MRRTLDIGADIIDSRDVDARIDELESELQDLQSAVEDAEAEAANAEEDDSDDAHAELEQCRQALEEFQASGAEDELNKLIAFRDELQGYCPDWNYGAATLIEDSYFTEYAIDMLKDIGDLPSNIPGYIVLDEDATADNIKQDYTSADIDGYTYWVR
jgi:hypothetical protein